MAGWGGGVGSFGVDIYGNAPGSSWGVAGAAISTPGAAPSVAQRYLRKFLESTPLEHRKLEGDPLSDIIQAIDGSDFELGGPVE